ncbi:MAG: hypothetical protein LWW81_07185 [Rhodocyclales bacterium]|nr:hypothetical protein [Rhodocyclales bacterium]
MCDLPRRRLLGGMLLSPLALSLGACKHGDWPEGMAEIKWDRDTCTRCSMVISDRRFAAEIRGGPENLAFKFDDPGCLAFWLKEKAEKYPWAADPATRIWLADYDSKSREAMHWLEPKRAYFITRSSPMGYNFAAVSMPQAGTLDFSDMRQHVLAKGK